ncbi:MAG TPA: manganese-binding transcriptional regulator MntR [Phycisphaerales bacterium]|nr:manganese-binding transcriptional regulator MntR [Phycisphaerales bacterium]
MPSARAKHQRKPRPARRGADDPASRYLTTRAAHAAETAEDYAEAIADLIIQHGEARVVDLARAMGVSHVTVVRTLARLRRDGLVETRPYRSIFLTPAGEVVAKASQKRHRAVVAFLAALGVPKRIAERDAEGIEHHVSAETLAAMERFAAMRE